MRILSDHTYRSNMKRSTMLLFAMVVGGSSTAQLTTLYAHTAQGSLEGDRLELFLTAHFTIGGGGWNCPPMQWSVTGNSPDTLRLNAVYNTYGTWQMSGCTSQDTIVIQPYTHEACIVEVRFFDHQSNATGSSDTVQAGDPEILTLCTVGLNSRSVEALSVTPNPFHDRLTMAHLPERWSMIALFDATGRKVLEQRRSSNSSGTVEVPGLRDGVYHLRITTDNGYLSRTLIKSAP